MQTKAKSNSVITHHPQEDGTIIFKVKDAGEFTFDPMKASEVNRTRAMRHGFVQRISDGGAISRDTATGKPADPSAKFAAMRRLADHYMEGSVDWSPARSEGATSGGLDCLTLLAVAEATGKTVEEVRAMVAAGAEKKRLTPKAYLTALGGASVVKPILERLRAAKAPAIDADGELEGLMG